MFLFDKSILDCFDQLEQISQVLFLTYNYLFLIGQKKSRKFGIRGLETTL